MIEIISGLAILFFSMIIQVIIPPIPAELIVISAGKIYGVLIATIVAGTGLFVGGVLVYMFGYWLQEKFKIFNNKKAREVINKIKEHEKIILWIRILPYNPSDIISYGAGIIRVRKATFLRISFFTSYIRCFLLAWLGSYITNVKSTLQVIGILIISAIVAHVIVYKRKKKK